MNNVTFSLTTLCDFIFLNPKPQTTKKKPTLKYKRADFRNYQIQYCVVFFMLYI